jgi:hypothetical protein
MNKIVPPLDDTTKDHVEQPEKSAETLSHRVSATYLSPITPNPLERLEARARVTHTVLLEGQRGEVWQRGLAEASPASMLQILLPALPP